MFQDLGFDQDGSMEILVERGTPLPHEMSCQMRLNGNSLKLYEGNRFETKQNRALGEYALDRDDMFVLSLHISKDYQLKILVDDSLLDTIPCSQVADDVPLEDTRQWNDAKKEFVDYVQSTLLFLQDPLTQKHVPEWKWAIEKLEWAKQITEYPVSTEEYQGALHEIESMINPVLQKTMHKKEQMEIKY